MAARDPAEALALWRYHLIAEALDPKLGAAACAGPRAKGHASGPSRPPRRRSRRVQDAPRFTAFTSAAPKAHAIVAGPA
jgi:hypothetical protein